MADDNKTCGNCAKVRSTDDGLVCTDNNERRGYFEVRSCWTGQDVFGKICKKCGRVLPLDQFPKHPRAKSGRTDICRDCVSEIHKKAAAEQPKRATPFIVTETDAKRAGKKIGNQAAKKITAEVKKAVQRTAITDYSDKELFDEMNRRGCFCDPRATTEQFTDQQLYDELYKRGWRGDLIRTETLNNTNNDEKTN